MFLGNVFHTVIFLDGVVNAIGNFHDFEVRIFAACTSSVSCTKFFDKLNQ